MTTFVLIDLLVIVAALFAYKAVRSIAASMLHFETSDGRITLVRGIRSLITAVCCVIFAFGLAFESRTSLIIATVILAEELYETGVALLILRHGRNKELAGS